MIWWSLLNRRLKTWLTICSILIVFISSALVYRALTSNFSMNNYSRHPESFLKKRIPQLQAKYKEFDTAASYQEFRKDLMLAHLIPGKFSSSHDAVLITPTCKKVLTDFLIKLYPTDWENVSETDEVALDLKYLLIDCDLESKISCKQIDNMILSSPMLRSESKYIDYAVLEVSQSTGDTGNVNGRVNKIPKYVIKSSLGDNDTRTACMKQISDSEKCATRGGYRLLREVLLLSALRHPGIVTMKGYCLRGNSVSQELTKKGIIIVMEMGVPLTMPLLGSCTWSQRVSMALQVVKLLLYLDSTPLGRMLFKNLTLSDFILIRGTIVKLADVDDFHLGNITCTDNSQCLINGGTLGVNCKDGSCDGLSSIMNLALSAKKILKPLLMKPPGYEETILVSRLDPLNITLIELVVELKIFFERSPPEGPVLFVQSEQTNIMDIRASPVEKYHSRDTLGKELTWEENQHLIFAARSEDVTKKVLSDFVRYDHKNLAGICDYFCAGSNVSWGCVFTVNSLLDAANLCLNDHVCQSFVVYSNHPESDRLMKVVLKNGTDPGPLVFSGTTLFVRRPPETNQNKAWQDEKQVGDGTSAQKSSSDIKTCMDNILQSQKSVYHSREKRLMTHLGLKDPVNSLVRRVKEQAWKRSAVKQKLINQIDIIKVDGIGGKFIANLTENLSRVPDKVAKKVMFISEDGPSVSHKAYALVYNLDRILGLYHTPLCVSRRLPAETVEHFRNIPTWSDLFGSLINSDRTLSGVLVVPAHKMIKSIQLTLQPLEAMISNIVVFDQVEKLQLEYILLMWLSRMERTSDISGYKNHLILFNADRAFTNLSVDMSGFLYHCQFPSHVYQSLECLRCDSQGKTTGFQSNICFLGEQVIRRTLSMFPDEGEFLIHGLKDKDLIAAINTAATSVLHIVDTCIKTFGQDTVLY